jgi:hypothetical protein
MWSGASLPEALAVPPVTCRPLRLGRTDSLRGEQVAQIRDQAHETLFGW